MKLLVKLMGGKPPERRNDSAGYDLRPRENIKIPALRSLNFGLGFAAAFDPRWVALLLDRSSVGKKGVMKLAGVIEGTYRGEWTAILYNSSYETFVCANETRVIQAVFVEYKVWDDIEIVDELPESMRAAGGFGSTEVIEFLATKKLRMINNYKPEHLELVKAWIALGAEAELLPVCVCNIEA
jgi:dUTP pyrophosphatase